ncbi:ATP-binding cassette domain-containing protein [Streptomyces sp. NPDC096079]|uniref:ATP-binding cassette domain-containing protein n=1 Tax=Streptomyces sp. NPDC096079 TaxID=3155820 RepID=UPI00333305DA
MLREVSLDLPAAALVRFVGSNGSGKSTLLRLLAGVDAPTEGRVTGRPARTAYVPERFPVALPFTALDYLVHLGRVQGLGRAVARARAGEWLERFGADGHAGTGLAALSKGTSQKVAVAQAFLADPGLLVLDEAWTGLDTGARAALDGAVRERLAAGATVVFVDHDRHRLAGEATAVHAVGEGRVREAAREPRPGPDGPPFPGPAAAPVRIVASGGAPGPGPEVLGPPAAAPVRIVASGGAPGPGPEVLDPPAAAPVRIVASGGAPGPGPEVLGPPAVPPVRIVASGGRALPGVLPGGPLTAPGPDGTTLLTVGAAHSDALLGVLLAASWHIHHLGTEGVRV